MRDVARAAGVSVATISRVINGKGPVREATRLRVVEAIARLGYVPHSAARSLSTRRTQSLGVLLPDLHGEFFSELIRGIDRTARRAGYHVFVSCSHSDPDEAEAVLRTLHGRVDGLVVMPLGMAGSLAPRLPRHVPLVLLSDAHAGGDFDSIRIDNRGGARSATEHLIELGHRRIATIRGPAGNPDAEERLQGFRDALAARGVPLAEAWVLDGDFGEESGHRAGARLAALAPRPTAVFAANDAMAIGCLAALADARLRVPADVALAGFDDVPIARFVNPPLTSVRVAIAALGGRAVERLLEALERPPGAAHHHEIVAATLVVRASTSPSPPRSAPTAPGG